MSKENPLTSQEASQNPEKSPESDYGPLFDFLFRYLPNPNKYFTSSDNSKIVICSDDEDEDSAKLVFSSTGLYLQIGLNRYPYEVYKFDNNNDQLSTDTSPRNSSGHGIYLDRRYIYEGLSSIYHPEFCLIDELKRCGIMPPTRDELLEIEKQFIEK